MASYISVGFTLTASDELSLQGIVDLELLHIGGAPILLAAAGAGSTVTAFSVAGRPVKVDEIGYSSRTGVVALSDIVHVPAPDGDRLMSLARYDDNIAFHAIGEGGALDYLRAMNGPHARRAFAGEALVLGDVTFLYTAPFGAPGIDIAQIRQGDEIVYLHDLADNAYLPYGDVAELHGGELKGRTWLFAASQQDAGVNMLEVLDLGHLRNAARMLPRDMRGWDNVTDVETVQIGERGFALIAGAGSDTVHVVRISRGGRAKLIDREEDTLFSRFEGVQDIEVFEHDGRTFVVAAGSDDGLTLFELTYRGKLVHLESFRDRFETPLKNVSSLEVRVEGDTAHVYAGSSAEHGVTELLVDLAPRGEVIHGDAVRDALYGGDGDDEIWGMGMSDYLNGRRGDDRLIDGRGRDTLFGGGGADIFEFLPDGRTDWIEDFYPHIDRIDLTSFDGVHHISTLIIKPTKRGAVVKVHDDIIRVYNPNGGPFDIDLFDDVFIFG